MRYIIVIFATLGAFLVLTTASVAQVPAEPQATKGEEHLQVTAMTSDKVEATFSFSRTHIELSSTASGGTEAEATIVVGGKTFQAHRASGTVTWGGPESLNPADIAALQASTRSLRIDLLAAGDATVEALPSHAELLMRFTMLLAEAPAGVTMINIKASEPAGTSEPAEQLTTIGLASASGACAGVEEGYLAKGAADVGERSSLVAPQETLGTGCQRSDEDGIQYWSCAERNRWVSHDAYKRCYGLIYLNAGKGSSGSLGECGPGGNGIDTFTQDCGDHDVCGRIHGGSYNPWDAECGDEYFEADDDFLWATINRC